MQSSPTLHLKVRKIQESCLFDLSNLNGRELSATVKYPEKLTELYQNWQQIYRRRYELQLRARMGQKGGSGTPANYDWDQELRIAEIGLLKEFYCWLGQAELLDIREAIQQSGEVATRVSGKGQGVIEYIDVLLDCRSDTLARLPWEAWRLTTKTVNSRAVRFARTCTDRVIPFDPAALRHGKARILVILAEAPDLNCEFDHKLLKSFSSLATVEFIHCREIRAHANTQLASALLKQTVVETIADPRGWDVIFFSGHSDESAITGGKLELAPQVTLPISELEPQLLVAKERGLQLAVFNSCSGLHIAESLLRLGIPQVVVMREGIQDKVAHKFLEQFCYSLSRYNDVHTAVTDASNYFASESISYPSAYLIPCLFRHPDPKAHLFRLEPSQLKRVWQQWRPTRWQAVTVGVLSFCSLVMPLQELLMEGRYLSQAVYRQITQQVPPITPLKVTLLKIDQASIDRRGIDAYKIKPMSRAYLAELVNRLQQLNVKVIGIDYLLDGSTKEDKKLATAVDKARQQSTLFVFATRHNDAGQPIQANISITQPDRVLQGDIDLISWDVMLPNTIPCREKCPFAYQLALTHLLSTRYRSFQPPSPATNLQNQVTQLLKQNQSADKTLLFLQQPELPLNLQPVIDFSLPPNRVYQSIAAWDFLERPLNDVTLTALQQQIVIIGSGGYDQADDNFPLPLAVQYWRSAKGPFMADDQLLRSQVFPGATTHAYAAHHLLSQHLLLPIPTLWMIGIAVILGKGATLLITNYKPAQQRQLVLFIVGGTVLYGGIALQSYITASIILPWLLPTVLFWLYIFPVFKCL